MGFNSGFKGLMYYSIQSDREQTSVMHNTKNYDKPRGQPPEPLHKLRNNRIKDNHLCNIRETKIAQLLYKTTPPSETEPYHAATGRTE